MLSNLIAISGVKGSGKNLTADMLQYCLSVPSIFRQYWIYKYFKKLFPKKWKIIAFADPLKKMLSVLLNVPMERFNDRQFKEECFVDLSTLEFSFSAFDNDGIRLSDNKFNKLLKAEESLNNYQLSIRQLMQYFGTNQMRKYFGDKIWVNSTLRNASKRTIISDLRFRSEADSIRQKAKLIYINRPGYGFGQHQSEKEIEQLLKENYYDFIIDNTGTEKDLFYKIKSVSK